MSIEIPVAPKTPSADVPDTLLQQDGGETQSRTADASVLITENEVRFGTAAAAGLRKRNRRRFAALSRIVAAVVIDSRPRTHDVPSRLEYLDYPRMAREMERL